MASVDSVIGKARAILRKCNEYTGEVSHDIWHAVQAVIDKSAGKIDPPTDVIEFNENGEYDVVNYGTAIVDVQGGIDVSDTTATASDVISGKVFHTSDGASTSGELVINSITPSNSSPVALTSGTNYKSSGSGYAISSYTSKTPSSSPSSLTSGAFYRMGSNGYLVDSISNITPQDQVPLTLSSGGNYHMNSGGYCIGAYSNASVDPRLAPSFNMGWNFMKTSGYAYSSKPSGGKSGTFTTSLSTITIELGFSPTYIYIFGINSGLTKALCCVYFNGTYYTLSGNGSTASMKKNPGHFTVSGTSFTWTLASTSWQGLEMRYLAI